MTNEIDEDDETAPKRGRPLVPIDVEKLKELARLGCSQSEIAAFFDCDQATISRRFASEFELARTECKIHVRRAQMRSADEGSVPMLIHLGKHVLGQTDKAATTHRFGFGELTHEQALAELDGLDDADAREAAYLRGLPRITVEFAAAPKREPGEDETWD